MTRLCQMDGVAGHKTTMIFRTGLAVGCWLEDKWHDVLFENAGDVFTNINLLPE